MRFRKGIVIAAEVSCRCWAKGAEARQDAKTSEDGARGREGQIEQGAQHGGPAPVLPSTERGGRGAKIGKTERAKTTGATLRTPWTFDGTYTASREGAARMEACVNCWPKVLIESAPARKPTL
jgi:hypothetical protein